MTPTSPALSQWLLHISGATELPRVLQRLTEAVELNRESVQILSTFGRNRFEGMIGFIDMRGFSALAKGCSPEEVRDIAAPFVAAVVEAARQNHCFVDKTIGDEVMLVMPSIGEDVALSNIGLHVRDPWPVALSMLVADILRLVRNHAPRRTFSAGFVFGECVLDRVGSDSYNEWTVYGNAVNATKRLQGLAAELGRQVRGQEANCFAVGVIKGERDSWFSSEFNLEIWKQVGPILLADPKSGVRDCKGVGEIRYISTEVQLRPEKSS